MESRWIRRFVATATIHSPGRVLSNTCLYSSWTNYVFLMTRLWIITPFVYLLISLMGRTTLTHVLQPLYSYNAVLTLLNASTANYTSNTTCNGWTDYPLGQIRCPNVIDRPTNGRTHPLNELRPTIKSKAVYAAQVVCVFVSARRKEEVTDRPINRRTDTPSHRVVAHDNKREET